jgi:hypothetical protein
VIDHHLAAAAISLALHLTVMVTLLWPVAPVRPARGKR